MKFEANSRRKINIFRLILWGQSSNHNILRFRNLILVHKLINIFAFNCPLKAFVVVFWEKKKIAIDVLKHFDVRSYNIFDVDGLLICYRPL